MSEGQVNGSKSTMLSKKFSVTLKNIDFNAYRAYKLVNDEERKGKHFNPHEVLKGEHNPMRFPFGLTEKRFRWQTSKNLGEKCELDGTMVRRYSQGNIKTCSDWPSFMEKTPLIEEKHKTCSSTRASSYKYSQNRITGRTILPDSCQEHYQMRKSNLNRSLATGSISNLLEKTPQSQPKHKLYSGKMIQGNEIFTPSDPVNKHVMKLPVDMENIRKSSDYAGVKYKTGACDVVESPNNSYSRQIKMSNLKSDVFSKKKVEDKNKRPPQYEYSASKAGQEENRSGPNIFKSNIFLN